MGKGEIGERLETRERGEGEIADKRVRGERGWRVREMQMRLG